MSVIVEVGGKQYELKNIEVDEGKERRILRVKDPLSEVEMELLLHKGRRHIRRGIIHISFRGRRFSSKLRRLDIDQMRRNLYYGREHHHLIGDILIRIKPEMLRYIFPGEEKKRFFAFLRRLWELGISLPKLGRKRKRVRR